MNLNQRPVQRRLKLNRESWINTPQRGQNQRPSRRDRRRKISTVDSEINQTINRGIKHRLQNEDEVIRESSAKRKVLEKTAGRLEITIKQSTRKWKSTDSAKDTAPPKKPEISLNKGLLNNHSGLFPPDVQARRHPRSAHYSSELHQGSCLYSALNMLAIIYTFLSDCVCFFFLNTSYMTAGTDLIIKQTYHVPPMKAQWA
ncbi:hypothetical protein AMEX_G26272 [Astyanax mexicanus]|uniref:Uncharacterized protein n=2 Tax=Astyanax mexicanus TaxID=7994 RepID=A0A8T2KWX9_ASTMX|nr:hypothetical protein AMEX_G26272 [Astyanax mexicanus]